MSWQIGASVRRARSAFFNMVSSVHHALLPFFSFTRARRIADSRDVILGVGLTRKFRASDDAPYRHWLQVNNIHLKEHPVWTLG